MSYILSLTVPVAYDADDDDHARVIAEHVEDVLLGTTLPHAAEVLEPSYVLEQDDRVVVGPDDFTARYAPLPATTGQGHEPCPECLDYIAHSNRPAGDPGIAVETVESDQ
jgi:hypothetical protein